MFLFSLGHARKAIEALADLAPKTAIVQRDGAEIEVRVEALQRGDRAVVKPGQRISADGVVAAGNSAVDQARVTGKSMPVDKAPGEGICRHGQRGRRADDRSDQAGAGEHAVAHGHDGGRGADAEVPTQRFTDRFERIFVLVSAGLLIVLPPLFGFPFAESFYGAMAVLVAASPCAHYLAPSGQNRPLRANPVLADFLNRPWRYAYSIFYPISAASLLR